MQGITQHKIKRQILGNVTFSNKIQAWKIQKFKQYYLAIISCLCFTQPVSSIALIVNSLPNSPVISTPTKLETVHSALLWEPFPCATCWDNVSSKLLTVGEQCSQERVCMACSTGALLSCWPNRENQSHFSQRPSYSLLLRRWQEEHWECCLSWLAQELWPTVPVCNQAISQNANQAQDLSLSMRHSSTSFSWLSRSGTEPLALQPGEIPVPSEHSPAHPASERCLMKEGSIFLQSYSFPEDYWRDSLDNLLRKGPTFLDSCCSYISISVCAVLNENKGDG